MRKVFFILTICLLFPSAASAADNFKRCSVAPKPQINFYTSYGKLVYDFSKTEEEISKMFGSHVLGLAQRKTGTAYQYSSASVRYGDGFCASLKKLDVYIGIQSPKIYVNSKFEEGSCLHKFVLRHEQAHMQVTVRMLEQFVTVAAERLFWASRQMKPILVYNQSEANAAYKIISDSYKEMIIQMRETLDKEIEIEQKTIDAEDLKGLESEVCGEDYAKYYWANHHQTKSKR